MVILLKKFKKIYWGNNFMKIFFDCEFTGLHKNTTLISIGLISEDNKTFYAELNDYDKTQVDDWIKENVINNLLFKEPGVDEDEHYIATRSKDNPIGNDLYASYSIELRGSIDKIKQELTQWLKQFNSVELVSDVCYYDMVLFADIFGHAFNLPNNVGSACYDINQSISDYYKIDINKAFDMSREVIVKEAGKEINGDKHNSLYDAKVIKEIYEFINNK